ncbi:MAG: hypothetical protein ACK2UR_18125 [Candidatus Promineifilaceae bacterium]
MDAANLLSEQAVTGWLLILSSLLFLPSGLLYTARVIWQRPAAQSRRYLYLERGLVMAAMLTAALGLVLLAQLLESAGDSVLSSMGMALFLIATVLIVAAETFSLGRQEGLYPTIVVSVILAFIGQALFGLSILRTGYLPAWVGWTAVIWNLAWLIILPVARRQDMYYPWLHYVAPLVIGIALLGRA